MASVSFSAAADNGQTKVWPDTMVSRTIPVIYITTQDSVPVLDKVNAIPAGFRMDPMQTDYDAVGSEENPVALTIRGRGNSSWFETEKKSYKLKFDKKHRFSGYPKASTMHYRHIALVGERLSRAM